MDDSSTYDTIVIGAGLGGLLAALHCLRRGQRVAIIERLAQPGGRFSARAMQGAQVSTGAVHLLPFGSHGGLARMLDTLDVPHVIHDATMFGSFHIRGRQYVIRTPLQLARVLGARQFLTLGRLGATLALRTPASFDRDLSFAVWLAAHGVTLQQTPELYLLFARMCEFALSVDVHDVSQVAVADVLRRMLAAGPPGVPEGGCAAVSEALAQAIRECGGALLLTHEVTALAQERSGVWHLAARNRRRGAEQWFRAHNVLSDIGPQATAHLIVPALLGKEAAGERFSDLRMSASGHVGAEVVTPPPAALGLKVQLLSSLSVIPHCGVMYCLDTRHIAGVVQPSNGDRHLAPPGEHLIVTHQMLRGTDIHVEEAAALADLRQLFGDDLGTRMRILVMSHHRGAWPVNRAVQGQDVGTATRFRGLYLVGDAVKASGYPMTEGVAEGVLALMESLDTASGDTPCAMGARRHTIWKPVRQLADTGRIGWSALRWILGPPRPDAHAKSLGNAVNQR